MPSSGSAWPGAPVASTTRAPVSRSTRSTARRWDGLLLRAGLDDATARGRRRRPLRHRGRDRRAALERGLVRAHRLAAHRPALRRARGPLALPLRPRRPARRHGPRDPRRAAAHLDARGGRARCTREAAPRHTPVVTRASPSPTSSGARDGGSRRRRATATSPRSSRWSRCGASACAGPSLPRDAVDGLAEEVRVTVVAGVLLDHVQQDPAQRELLALLASQVSPTGNRAHPRRAPRRCRDAPARRTRP